LARSSPITLIAIIPTFPCCWLPVDHESNRCLGKAGPSIPSWQQLTNVLDQRRKSLSGGTRPYMTEPGREIPYVHYTRVRLHADARLLV
jgi:hypothetical protein